MGDNKRLPSYDTNRSVLGEILPLSTPFKVILDASEACNFRCSYCFRSQDDKSSWGYAQKTAQMDWDLFQWAVSQIQGFPEDIRLISLSNHGEPLCNRRLPDMVRYIKSQGIPGRVSIHTNAALLDKEYVLDLADSNIDKIVVSLQGLSSEKYQNVCGVVIDFESFYENLSLLYQKKKSTQLYLKIMDIALDDGEEDSFYQLFSPIGDRVFVEKAVPIWKGVDPPSTELLDNGYNKYGDQFPIQSCCPVLFHTIVVAPNGDVYPCTQLLNPFGLGNIKEHSLRELWSSPARTKLLMGQCKGNPPNMCKGCFICQNSVFTKEDMIDPYREKILSKLILHCEELPNG